MNSLGIKSEVEKNTSDFSFCLFTMTLVCDIVFLQTNAKEIEMKTRDDVWFDLIQVKEELEKCLKIGFFAAKYMDRITDNIKNCRSAINELEDINSDIFTWKTDPLKVLEQAEKFLEKMKLERENRRK
jgi:hypothetical protein